VQRSAHSARSGSAGVRPQANERQRRAASPTVLGRLEVARRRGSSRSTSAPGAAPRQARQPDVADLEQPAMRRRQRPQPSPRRSSSTPSSPTSAAPRSISASARLDLPLPGGPRSARRGPPIATQLAWCGTRSRRGQLEHEAGAGASVGPVGDDQRAVVRLGDRARDGEAEAAVVAEPSVSGRTEWNRANTFSRSASGMPGPSSQTLARTRPSTLRTQTSIRPLGRERHRVVEQVLDDPLDPQRHAEHPRLAVSQAISMRRPALSPRSSRARTRFSISAARSIGSNVARLSSASIRLASAISVTSRSIRRTSCRAISVSCARSAGILDLGQRFDRAAQRGERVLDLVRDVGAEGLDRVDPLAQRRGHVDTAPASTPISSPRSCIRGTSTSRARPSRTRTGGAAEPAQRLDDRAREVQREHGRDDQRERDHDQQRGARVAHRLGDVGGVARGQQRGAVEADRRGGGDHRGAVGRAAQLDLGPPCSRAPTSSGQASASGSPGST
jgi:hypothetical protein